MTTTPEEKIIEAEVDEYMRRNSWGVLLKDPRVWAVIVLSAAMSTSVFRMIEKSTGLELNPSVDRLTNSCVQRALYEGELEPTERLAAAKVCVPKP